MRDRQRSVVGLAGELGIELLPWQREYAEAIDRGESPVLVGGRRGGRKTMQRLVELNAEIRKQDNEKGET